MNLTTRSAGLLAAVVWAGCASQPVTDAGEAPAGGIDGACTGTPGKPRVLVYTYENMWRHLSNLSARQLIADMCASRGFNVVISNDPHIINAGRLAELDVVVFAVTSGSGLDAAARVDFEAWLHGGGGIVGLHSASATEWDFPFYVANMGPRFSTHAPGQQAATVRVVPGSHPITDGLPSAFTATDEWYDFESRPEDAAGMQMLFALDEDSLPAEFPAENKVGYHPIAWAHELYGGRVFYTAMGHNPDDYVDPSFQEIVGRAIEWAARQRQVGSDRTDGARRVW